MGTDGARTPAGSPADANTSENWQSVDSASKACNDADPELAATDNSFLRPEASRRNGSKSRGPKTTKGKSQSRVNAVKHGMRAKTLLLEIGTEEENAAIESLRCRIAEQFPARTIEEQLVLESMVLALWQKKRGLQFEARELRQDLVFHGPVMDRILRYATSADKRLFRALEQLKLLQAEDSMPNHENAEQE